MGAHPNFYSFIEKLRSEQTHTEKLLADHMVKNNSSFISIRKLFQVGKPIALPVRKYAMVNARLRTIVAQRQNRTVEEYLRAIANNIQFISE